MRIIQDGDRVTVSEIDELAAAGAGAFKAQLSAALSPAVRHIEIDLSRAALVDCAGLGALVALRQQAHSQDEPVTIRLRNPTRATRRILSVTGLDRAFSVTEDLCSTEAKPEIIPPLPAVAA